MLFAKPLAELVGQFEKLPGVGPKSAQRLAFHVLRMTHDDVRALADALRSAKEHLRFCSLCQNVSEHELCEICTDARRDQRLVCVVGEARDIAAIERLNEYKGVYHVLHGLLNPMEGVGPEQLKVRELVLRMKEETEEIILATNPTIEGDTTALYLAKLLKPLGVKVTRLAHGMPVGGELDYADHATLLSAIEFRREM